MIAIKIHSTGFYRYFVFLKSYAMFFDHYMLRLKTIPVSINPYMIVKKSFAYEIYRLEICINNIFFVSLPP